jgi:hypothetical protein
MWLVRHGVRRHPAKERPHAVGTLREHYEGVLPGRGHYTPDSSDELEGHSLMEEVAVRAHQYATP